MHAGLKRNFQPMPGAEWLALLCKHIPDRHEHLVCYAAWYSDVRPWIDAIYCDIPHKLPTFVAKHLRNSVHSPRILASLINFAHIIVSVRFISAYCSGVVPVGA